MYCRNCGSEITPGQKFCMECGAPVGTAPSQAECQGRGGNSAGRYAAPPKKKKSKFKIAAIGIPVIFLFLVLFAFLGDSEEYYADPMVSPSESSSTAETQEQVETSQESHQSEYIARSITVAQSEYQKYLELESIGDFMQEAFQNNITLQMLNRQPEYYIDKKVYFGGVVVQALYNSDSPSRVDLRVRVSGDNSSNNIIYVSYTLKEGETRILEDDYVDIYGISKGLITYESVLGNDITIPHILGKYIFCSASTDGSLVSPVMEEVWTLLQDHYISEEGEPFSFSTLENSETNILSDATDYGDCIAVYYTPMEGWDMDNPPPFLRITVFRDGMMVIFEPSQDAEEGIYSVDDGTYTLYTPTETEASFPGEAPQIPAPSEPNSAQGSQEPVIGYVSVSSGDLKIRSGPSTSYQEIGRLPNGKEVTIYEIQSEGNRDWGRIDSGWVCMDYIVFEKPSAPLVAPPFDFIIDIYVGKWQDKNSQRCSMSVSYQNGLFSFDIRWGNSASSTSHWTMSGGYDDASNGVRYFNGKYSIIETTESGEQVEYVQYTNGEGLFRLAKPYLHWDDYEEWAGVNCEFEKHG